jgi:hypothetical protein
LTLEKARFGAKPDRDGGVLLEIEKTPKILLFLY